MIGKECESDWSLKSHLIASTQVSSTPRRRQRIDDHTCFMVSMIRERLGYRLGRWLNKVQEDLKGTSAILEHLYTQDNGKGTKFTGENKAEPIDPNNEIFSAAILHEEEILKDLEEDRRTVIPSRRKLPPPNQKLD
ncbi:hypothetical protein EV426DRAFT_710476 [Tirmania nivea]|nr:hypothetical protein EV426DRAFT_710476 [Tirmania nivea]